MTQLHDTTESIKGKHLTKNERAQIEILNQEGYSNRAIAKRLERAPPDHQQRDQAWHSPPVDPTKTKW